MSDLLAPVLIEVHNEADSFWCFVNLMEKALFVCTPTDSDMDLNLVCYYFYHEEFVQRSFSFSQNLLRELIRIMQPTFYEHLLLHTDAMELLFTHRWILL